MTMFDGLDETIKQYAAADHDEHDAEIDSDDDHRISSRFDEDEEEEVTLTSDDDDHGVDDRDDDELDGDHEKDGDAYAPVVAAEKAIVFTPPASPSAGYAPATRLSKVPAPKEISSSAAPVAKPAAKKAATKKTAAKKAVPVKAAAKKATPKKGAAKKRSAKRAASKPAPKAG